jgi:chromosome segregation ATPase
MKIHRSTISAVAAFLLTAAAAGAQTGGESASRYREAYITLQDALKLQYENRKEEALLRYEDARDKLKDLLAQFPDMNRETIQARIAKCQEAIDNLKEEVAASSPAVLPAEGPVEPAAAAEYAPGGAGISPAAAMAEISTSAAPQPAAGAFMRAPKDTEGKAERADLMNQLQATSADLEKSRAEKAALEAELEKTRAEADSMRREIQNINTSLGMAIADLEKEREVKAKIEEEAMKAQTSSEEILKNQLAQALADKKKVETEAMQAYQASEEIMRDQLEKQKEDHLKEIEQERQKAAAESAAPPIEQLQQHISAYQDEVEKARRELSESLKMIAASQETHKKLLEANRDLEKRIGTLSESVARTEQEAELVDLSQATEAEEEKLKKTDITKGPPAPSPEEKQVLAGEISEKNDEYGKVFIDFSTDVQEGEDLLAVRDHEVIARLKVTKVFPSIKGGIANVTPKEDTYELRKKDKVFVSRREPTAPAP